VVVVVLLLLLLLLLLFIKMSKSDEKTQARVAEDECRTQ